MLLLLKFKEILIFFKNTSKINPKDNSIAAKLKIKKENEIKKPSSIIVLIILHNRYNKTHINSEIKIKKKKLYVFIKKIKNKKKNKKLKKFIQLNIKFINHY